MKLSQFEAEHKPTPLSHTSYPTHRPGCRCLRCIEEGKVPGMESFAGPPNPMHQPGCGCGMCRKPISQRMLVVGGPVQADQPQKCNTCGIYFFSAKKCPNGCTDSVPVLPKEVPCHIRHAPDKACDCTAPQIVNEGMLQATESAALYMLSAMKMDAKPRSGLTREDLDFLAVSTARMAAHWARRALGQQDLI